jgi:LemA protein
MFIALSYVIGFFVVCALLFAGSHNRLIRLQHQAEQALSTVEVIQSERHHLLRQLLQALELQNQHAAHLLEAAEQAKALPARSREKQQLEVEITRYTHDLMQRTDQLPSVSGHLHFQRSVREVESQLSAAWRAYNAAATAYNRSLHSFPTNIAGQLLKLNPAPLYQN